tara:strand:- start:1719 stop:1949 length:231 start_codon:yes stop_codon:yes gene_type:complete
MNNKGFEAKISLEETPNFEEIADKPLINPKTKSPKVDINVLKARAQIEQNKENRKNVFIFAFFLLVLGIIGIYLSI